MPKSKYQFRGYPCNCDITGDYNFKQLLGKDAPKDLICSNARWCITGNFDNQFGILEWCSSFEDAITIRDHIEDFCKCDDKIGIQLYSIEHQFKLGDYNQIKECRSSFNSVGIGDIVIIHNYDQYSYLVAKVLALNPINDLIKIKIIYDSTGDVTWFKPALIPCKYVSIVIYRGKNQRPINSFHCYEFDDNTFHNSISKLPFTVIRKYIDIDYITDAFKAQYAQRQNGKLNKKLFNSWLRRNYNKVSLSTDDCNQPWE